MRGQELPIEATADGLLLHDPYEPMRFAAGRAPKTVILGPLSGSFRGRFGVQARAFVPAGPRAPNFMVSDRLQRASAFSIALGTRAFAPVV